MLFSSFSLFLLCEKASRLPSLLLSSFFWRDRCRSSHDDFFPICLIINTPREYSFGADACTRGSSPACGSAPVRSLAPSPHRSRPGTCRSTRSGDPGLPILDAATPADVLGGVERPSSGEERETPQEGLLGVVQMLVAPVDQGAAGSDGAGGRCGSMRSGDGTDHRVCVRSPRPRGPSRARRQARSRAESHRDAGKPAPPPGRWRLSGKRPVSPRAPLDEEADRLDAHELLRRSGKRRLSGKNKGRDMEDRLAAGRATRGSSRGS